MIIKLFKDAGVTVINVVRRQEQVDLLKKEYAAEHVLNSSEAGFDEALYELAHKLNATVCLEAVAGEMPGRCL